jgi:DNA-binding NarL/FixJ family response regulator
MNVLIIDDSFLMRNRLKLLLTELSGVHVTGEAASLSEIPELVENTDPDIIFMDIRLKDGVSIDYIKNLKELESHPVIIIITNYPYPQYRTICFNAGADYFVEKKAEYNKIPEILQRIREGKVEKIDTRETKLMIDQDDYKIWWDEKNHVAKAWARGIIDETEAMALYDGSILMAEKYGNNRYIDWILFLYDIKKPTLSARKILLKHVALSCIRKYAYVGASVFVRTIANFITTSAGKKEARHFSTEKQALDWIQGNN